MSAVWQRRRKPRRGDESRQSVEKLARKAGLPQPNIIYTIKAEDIEPRYYPQFSYPMPASPRSNISRLFRLVEWLVLLSYLAALVVYYASFAKATAHEGGLFTPVVLWQLAALGAILGASQLYILMGVSKNYPRVTLLLSLRALLVLAFGGLVNRSLTYTIIGAALLVESVAYRLLLSRSKRGPPGTMTTTGAR